ncbi:hypothetical protein ABGB18_42560 [Nonomuraea sp. B12E4]
MCNDQPQPQGYLVECKACDGKGKKGVMGIPCDRCNGTGKQVIR